MKIITVTDDMLKKSARQLVVSALEEGFKPIALIGVVTGGWYITKHLEGFIEKQSSSVVRYLPITLQRPCAKHKKKSLLIRLLKYAPNNITSFLRKLEHILRIKQKQNKRYSNLLTASFNPDEIKKITELPRNSNVMIIDDAIDTGSTLNAILETLKKRRPDLNFKIGVITVTMEKPLVDADYKIYNNTLCRFPWSADYNEDYANRASSK